MNLVQLKDRSFLIRNLCFLQRLIVASAPLLQFGMAHARGDLHGYFAQHWEEEVGHDEMLAEDLVRLGVEDIPPCHTAASIAGSQYYLIAHEHPAMLLGYMLVLESNPLPMCAVEELERVHGVYLDSLRHHSLHDGDHAARIRQMIESCTPGLRERIEVNAQMVAGGLLGVAKRLAEGNVIL
jgi:hypothetical protein